jgi:hypothetical protein
MRTVIAGLIGALVGILVAIMLEGILLPHFQPLLTPVLPAINEAIQSTIASHTDAIMTVNIRYAAAGFRDPADVLLTFISLLVVFGVAVGGIAFLPRLPRPIEPARKRYAIEALVLLAALAFGYLVYVHATELGARSSAMLMYKQYQRKMAAVAPYISPQEAREINSRWALMNDKADLQAMDARFTALMRQHGLLAGSPPTANTE